MLGRNGDAVRLRNSMLARTHGTRKGSYLNKALMPEMPARVRRIKFTWKKLSKFLGWGLLRS